MGQLLGNVFLHHASLCATRHVFCHCYGINWYLSALRPVLHFSAGSGGPNDATLTIVLLIYQYAFKNLDMGYALALTLMLAIVLMTATIIQRKLFKEERLD